jgi:hypothetical protein
MAIGASASSDVADRAGLMWIAAERPLPKRTREVAESHRAVRFG